MTGVHDHSREHHHGCLAPAAGSPLESLIPRCVKIVKTSAHACAVLALCAHAGLTKLRKYDVMDFLRDNPGNACAGDRDRTRTHMYVHTGKSGRSFT